MVTRSSLYEDPKRFLTQSAAVTCTPHRTSAWWDHMGWTLEDSSEIRKLIIQQLISQKHLVDFVTYGKNRHLFNGFKCAYYGILWIFGIIHIVDIGAKKHLENSFLFFILASQSCEDNSGPESRNMSVFVRWGRLTVRGVDSTVVKHIAGHLNYQPRLWQHGSVDVSVWNISPVGWVVMTFMLLRD